MPGTAFQAKFLHFMLQCVHLQRKGGVAKLVAVAGTRKPLYVRKLPRQRTSARLVAIPVFNAIAGTDSKFCIMHFHKWQVPGRAREEDFPSGAVAFHTCMAPFLAWIDLVAISLPGRAQNDTVSGGEGLRKNAICGEGFECGICICRSAYLI